MNTSLMTKSPADLCQYNNALLMQAVGMVDRLLAEAHADFVYAQAVGPHVRHIVEHYQALLDAIANSTWCVDYDARSRDQRMQSEPAMTQAALRALTHKIAALAEDQSLTLDTPLCTRLKAGASGELELQVMTSLGRELLFLASHTVHHYALIGHYCRASGVDMGHDFGKAPATIGFEKAQAVVSA